MPAIEVFWAGVHGAFGLVVGSFLNVVIWRLPRNESLVHPRSRCPRCAAPIAWFDNVPVLSWLWLRARCRGCRAPIAARYPLVELLTGALFVLAALAFPGDGTTSAQVCLLLAALVAVTFIDLDLRIIPDRITKPGMVFFALVAPFNALHQPGWITTRPALDAWMHALAGIAVGAGVVWAIRAVGSAILRKEAMGLGDVKLLGLIGAVVGPWQALYALVLGSFAGAGIGLLCFAWGRRRPMDATVELRATGGSARGARVRVVDDGLLIYDLKGALPAGAQSLSVELRLPARRILEEEDALLRFSGRCQGATGAAPLHLHVRESDLQELDLERLGMFRNSYKYIPFGPFLALGGAVAALYGERLHAFITSDYPQWVRGWVAP